MIERQEPTPAQIKAASSPLRVRILRLCSEREWTNKELADRLERDPATILHHLRLLVDAGLIEPVAVRQGKSGAYEKPYRSTGLSWQISFGRLPDDEEQPGEVAALSAFNQELAEAANDSIADLERFYLHLDAETFTTFVERLCTLLDEYVLGDDERRAQGAPAYNGLLLLHRLGDLTAPAPPRAEAPAADPT
jgi:DNA-binding transcriptional ArsR family regulator